MPGGVSDKPSTIEGYIDWYDDEFADDLNSGSAEQWYDQVAAAGKIELEGSAFWTTLQASLHDWNLTFRAEHDDYPLFETPQPTQIAKKSFESILNKSFRWNVFDNDNWPNPPTRSPSTAPKSEDPDREDKQCWYGPHNWIDDFPDIFRTRLVAKYFDGVGYFAERVNGLAQQTTPAPPVFGLRASHDGYHAAHLGIYHQLNILDYENSDPVTVRAQLEIQVTTVIQATINEMLHRVYEVWRLNGAPPDWEWDHRNPAFSVNYLGSTLHYLEGMIVMARVKMENR